MILMIDNYDSFTWNLVQYLGELGAEVRVARNDEIDIAAIEKLVKRNWRSGLTSAAPAASSQVSQSS